MTAIHLLSFITLAWLNSASPEHVASRTVLRNAYTTSDETAWWIQGGRFLDATDWIRHEFNVWPCWEIEWRRSHFPLDAQVMGTFNDLRERKARQLESNRRELEKAGLLP